MRLLLVLGGLLLVVPAAAQGHGAGRDHRATDMAGTPVSTLERRAQATTRRLGRRPGTRSRSAAKASAALDPGAGGRWSGVLPAPVVPVFEALLPNGKVLMWDSVGDAPAESYEEHTYTRAAVYDPVANRSTRVDVAGANIFCAGFVQLANGNVFVAGGNADSGLAGIRKTHIFDWRTETWSRGPDMRDGRWYPSVAALPNDEAVIVGGGPTVAEVRTSSGGLRRPTGLTTPSSRAYPFVQAAPDGRALLLGDGRAMSLMDPFGTGSTTPAGTRDAIDRGYGGYAPYDVGRFLVAGGGWEDEDGLRDVPSRTATTVDTRSGTPAGAATGSMAIRRRQHNVTVLADGSVLATGGQRTTGGGGLVDLDNAVYAGERWDPATGRWTELNEAAVARQYHSTAMLLPDGRVLTGGGGICGVCHDVGYLRRDFEVFTPPYLYRRDGSGQLAARPTLTAPEQLAYDTPFAVTSPQAASIRRVALVRLGAPTHGQDQGQRYVPLAFTVDGTTLTVDGPANPNEAPAGHYMLFAIDAAGVPSHARMVQVQRSLTGSGAVPLVAHSGTGMTGPAQRFEVGHYDAARGNLGQVGTAAVRSATVAAGYVATVCRGGGLADCTTLPAGQYVAMPAGFDRAVRSLRVAIAPPPPPPPPPTPTPTPTPAPGPAPGPTTTTTTTTSPVVDVSPGPGPSATPGPTATPAPATPPAHGTPAPVRLSFDEPFRRKGVATRTLTGRLTGSASPLGVRIAISRPWKGSKTRCAWWTPRRGRFGSPTRCDAPTYFKATPTRTGDTSWRWRAPLGGALRPGAYAVTLRAFDARGRAVPSVTARYPPAASARRSPLTAQAAKTTSSPAPIP